MIRAPGVNAVLNGLALARQILRRQNAFEEAVIGRRPPSSFLDLRELSSPSLWLLACRRSHKQLSKALAGEHRKEVEELLAQYSELLRFSQVLDKAKALRPQLLLRLYSRLASRWYYQAVTTGLQKGLVKPGETKGIPSAVLLQVKNKEATEKLMEDVQKQQANYNMTLQRGLQGKGYLDLNEEDLIGLSNEMKSVWESHLGSAAVWRKTKYRVPIGHDSLGKISSFCQNGATRKRLFQEFYAGFDSSLDEAALELLRARKRLAEKLGFRSYADLEMAPMAVRDEATARRFMDQCWKDAQPAMSKVVKKMKDWSGRGGKKEVSQVDQVFWQAMVTREADTWKLAHFLPADRSLPRLLEVVGKAYSVTFREVDPPSWASRLLNGWHKSVQVFEVTDGPPSAVRALGQRPKKLGYVYLDLYRRISWLGRPALELAGAARLCPGHAYLCCNLVNAGVGQGKLLSPEEVVGITHELGHAVHMLCHTGSPSEFDDLPLDVLELPSTLLETIAVQPENMTQYARHWSSESLPDKELLRSCQRDSHFFVRVLQNASISLGLHAEDFDPFSSTASDVRAKAVALWQRYSTVEADPIFTPLGGDAGLNVGHGANHVAYLLCYLRVASILQNKGGRKDVRDRLLQPEFASRLRSQLLDANFPGERMASIHPTLVEAKGRDLPHPLPPLPSSTSLLFQQVA
ncbi:unnamed protein product [Cladocopium goreaui]|uniref:Peptidase M3A/M3B catalytic domain-containing protein n=1 Tax=Cladocopium goreaui TaxID=2562237 RepID=A0A9P1CAX7_9DINO|nr:unnamed protein product [Cladocopium goreaui]